MRTRRPLAGMRAALPVVGGAARSPASVLVTRPRLGLGETIIFAMGSQNAASKTPQDTLSSYFDDSATAVRQTFSRCVPQSPVGLVHSSPTLCQIRKRLRSSDCRPHKVPLYGVSDIFCEVFERFPNQFHLIQSAVVGYRFSSRPLPFSAYFPFSHSCMSLL
jgi:hypothetical protein